ncbi:Rne/Rng family ribonuclease [Cognatishimia activa]|uniref:Ribonuclease E n=1 Tax=Cognatishimia activa TaxID=1715691 RepID=A0A0P1INZ8_9RHOB|nr:ribonuclease E/G [Cognatishimia activa]CUJ26345.1 Ribonuclease E [Cognatishimia activa]CUK25309.1 Ribonuclease E [Cognatishimia activa]
MAKKMLIDATHAEETRVVVVDGNKVEEFDFESENKRQLAGNIYLAKVTRVEPSLQAAFVDYGGNRHGFLAFSEIHPDYYQIPVADREALMEEERAYAEAMKARDEEEDKPKPKRSRRSRAKSRNKQTEAAAPTETAADQIEGMETIDLDEDGTEAAVENAPIDDAAPAVEAETAAPEGESEAAPEAEAEEKPKKKAPAKRKPRARKSTKKEDEEKVASEAPAEEAADAAPVEAKEEPNTEDTPADKDDDAPGKTMAAKSDGDEKDAVATQDPETGEETVKDAAPVEEEPAEDAAAEETAEDAAEAKTDAAPAEEAKSEETAEAPAEAEETNAEEAKADDADEEKPRRKRSKASEKDASIESVADDDDSEDIRPPRKPRPRRYKIQEVIKVRQILLVQVVKEERGNKGAALTTYLSLAGRYCVLMPNTARGGGISRKITNVTDRKKLKEIANEIDVPTGAGLIIRTAGAKRTKTEIKRDYEYLQRLWEQIRELTLKSSAPAKIYEEGDLIKRSIRDLYNREIDEVMVEGERGYRIAKDFMKMIMPSHAKNVKNYQDQLPLFARYQVESYLGGMFNPTVQLKSGGYIVIGVTEALVAVDVNSGRATKEGSIEDTAVKTNLEAAEEVARQLRLRDLAGLIVIDFIDMDERKNNTAVEKRLKDKLKTDRARIQVGRISGFGLLEMSRQRLRPGMIEATTQPCPHCHGTGLIRSDDNLALSILRQIEEEGTRRRSREVLVKVPVGIANYLMNQKREHIAQIEARYGLSVRVEGDPHLVSPDFTLEKFKTATRIVPEVQAPVVSVDTSLMEQIDSDIEDAEVVDETPAEDEEAKPKKRRRRRRRRKPRGGDQNGEEGSTENADTSDAETSQETDGEAVDAAPVGAAEEAPAEVSEEAKEEKPKRKPRRRSSSKSKKAEEEAKAAEPVAEEAPTEAQAPVEPVVDAAPAQAEPAAEVAVAEPVAEPAPEPVAETVVEEPKAEAPKVEEPKSDAPPKPKRKGWWSMK